MLVIDKYGKVINNRVNLVLAPAIQKRPLVSVRGIIVHQTDGPTAQAAFNSYKAGVNGAHFLIGWL